MVHYSQGVDGRTQYQRTTKSSYRADPSTLMEMEGLNTKGPLIKLSSRSINIDGDGRTQYQRTTNQAIEPINRQLFFFVDILSVQVTSYLGSRIRSRDKLWLIQVVIRFECDIKCSFPSASDRGIRVHLGLK